MAAVPQEEVRRPDYTENGVSGRTGHWGWTEVWLQAGNLTMGYQGNPAANNILRAKSSRREPEEPRVTWDFVVSVPISQHLALNLLTSHHSLVS